MADYNWYFMSGMRHGLVIGTIISGYTMCALGTYVLLTRRDGNRFLRNYRNNNRTIMLGNRIPYVLASENEAIMEGVQSRVVQNIFASIAFPITLVNCFHATIIQATTPVYEDVKWGETRAILPSYEGQDNKYH